MEQLLRKIPGYQPLRYFFNERSARFSLLEMMPKGSICAEIGVDKGEFSQQILKLVQPQKLHLIDPWQYQEEELYREARYGASGSGSQAFMDERYQNVVNKFSDEIQSGRISIHRGYSNLVCSQFEDNYFDWVYIDGNHSYEFVKQDLELYYDKVKKGGFITGDDYGTVGWWKDGLNRAVDEFVAKGAVNLIKLDKTQFILKKK